MAAPASSATANPLRVESSDGAAVTVTPTSSTVTAVPP